MNLKEEISNLQEEMGQVNDLFYQQKDKQGYERFAFMVSRISSVLDELYAYKQVNNELPMDIEKLTVILREAMNAMEAKDAVLLADILQYDFMEMLGEMKAAL